MPKFKNDDGLTVETDLPREQARLRSEGFQEVKASTPKPAAKTESK